MSPTPAELLSTAQQEERIHTSGQARPLGVMGSFGMMDPAFVWTPKQMQEVSRKKEKAVTKLVTNLASGFESMVEAHEQLGSVASSSQQRSQQALDLIRKEQAAREKDRFSLQAEIDALRATLKDQMEVSREALSALENTKKELQEERDQSRSLQNELLISRRQFHSQTGPSHVQSRPTVPMPDVSDRLRARLQTAKDQLTQQSTQQKGDPSPSAPPLAAEPWSFSQPLSQAMPDMSQNPFSVHIKPRGVQVTFQGPV